MAQELLTIAEAVSQYVATLPPEERPVQQPELTRFVRWFGASQPLEGITAPILDSYQEQVARSGADPVRRLGPVKDFLAYAQREKLTSGNFSKHIRLKRPGGRKETQTMAVVRPMERAIVLTPEGRAKLRAELEDLIKRVRPLVAQELREARADRDIRENAPYDAAKTHQAQVEARIRELEGVLGVAAVLESQATAEQVALGTTVWLRDLASDKEMRYTLVGSTEADPAAGKISVVSPVGRALLDHTVGDEVEVPAPAGRTRYRIEKIEP